jgi:drug/metabolite transporter (DMT)-like permease
MGGLGDKVMGKAKAFFKEHNNLLGALLVLIHALAIAILYGLIKELRNELSTNLIMFLYKFLILLMILPSCLRQGLKSIRTRKLHLHVVRALLSLSGGLAFFYAVKFIELVDATAVGYLEQVLWAVIGMVYFAEKVTIAKIASVILSFLGAVLIVYPEVITLNHNGIQIMLNNNSFKGFNYYYIFVFLSIILWAGNCVVVKLLSNTESTKTQLFYVMMFSSLFSMPVAFFEWDGGSSGTNFLYWTVKSYSFDELGLKLEHVPMILLLALCYFIHSITFFTALKHAELSAVIPFDYSRLVFTGLIGYMFFNEAPKFGEIIGLLLIVASGVYLIKAETNRVRNKTKQRELQVEYENT